MLTSRYNKSCSGRQHRQIITEQDITGCGSAWLERLVWDQEVAGSNPVTPIKKTTHMSCFFAIYQFYIFWKASIFHTRTFATSVAQPQYPHILFPRFDIGAPQLGQTPISNADSL